MLYEAIQKACQKYHLCGYGPRYDSTLEDLCVWDRKQAPNCGQVESIRRFVNPHFPYQPCRACRNQQRNYPM